MPAMSTIERLACQSPPWQAFSRRVVFPWTTGGADLRGDVLELGSGSGTMAKALLDEYPSVRLVATDPDPAMTTVARRRLAPYGERVQVLEADATSLPFASSTFDAVVSFIMLHHVINWEHAIAETARVLRPGGIFAGYDLLDTRTSRLIHRLDGSPHRLYTRSQLQYSLVTRPFGAVSVSLALKGQLARFRALRTT